MHSTHRDRLESRITGLYKQHQALHWADPERRKIEAKIRRKAGLPFHLAVRRHTHISTYHQTARWARRYRDEKERQALRCDSEEQLKEARRRFPELRIPKSILA